MADPPVPPARIALNINLDMISRSDKDELYAVGGVNWPKLQPVLDEVAATAPVSLRFGHEGHLARDEDDDWTALSDHVAFHEQGIPFVYFGKAYGPEGVLAGWGIGAVAFGALSIMVCFSVLKKMPQAGAHSRAPDAPPTAQSPFSTGKASLIAPSEPGD